MRNVESNELGAPASLPANVGRQDAGAPGFMVPVPSLLMIVLLGASGYIGRAFGGELQRRGWAFTPVSRTDFDYSRFEVLLRFLRETKPVFLINAAGYA